MFKDRLPKYKELEEFRHSRLLVYVTGDRQGMETVMHSEVVDRFVRHLDAMTGTEKISLILHSRGGETISGWTIANLIRSFCKDFEVIVPIRATSAATLLCLGADRIVMTRQAVLGPIDPNVNTPLNPPMPGAPPNIRIPVSVEAIKGFVQLAKEEFGIKDSHDMVQVLSVLSANVPPLVLGEAFRARSHIKMLANSLLRLQFAGRKEKSKVEKIVKFLCSESGSHDYTLNRTEAREQLGLHIERPNDREYTLIHEIFEDIQKELELTTPFNPPVMVAASPATEYMCRRALIESCNWGTDVFISKGVLTSRQQVTPGGVMTQIEDRRSVEGWRTERWPQEQ